MYNNENYGARITTCTYNHHTVTVGQCQSTFMSCHTFNITCYILLVLHQGNKIYIFIFQILAFINIMISRVHNIIEEESILLSISLYKCVLQSHDAIVIVTFEVLSNHVMFWKHIDIFHHVS